VLEFARLVQQLTQNDLMLSKCERREAALTHFRALILWFVYELKISFCNEQHHCRQ